MSERGKKVNKNSPANRAARKDSKKASKDAKVEKVVKALEGIAPRKPSSVPDKAVKPGVSVKPAPTESDLLTPEQKKVAEASARAEVKSKSVDVGPSQRGKARRAEEKSQRESDEADVTEARREKSPSEQASLDAAATGVTTEELVAIRAGNASFINQKPKTESNFEPVNLAVADIDQPKGSWSPSTGTGIFTPAPTGAVRGNRAQPTLPAVQENTEGRIKSGMGLPGMQENAPSEIINHPVHGNMEVPADVARAHRLYDLDFQKNSGKANRLAGIQGSEDYASPYAHKGGHYERLGRLQAAGENPDDISTYARKMGKDEYEVVEGKHALLQDKIDSGRSVNYGMQHLHPNDTFTHPTTGETHSINDWSTVHNMPVTGEGLPELTATKGTNVSMYKDSRGDLQTTVPTHIGWWKTPTDNKSGRENLAQRPGNWNYRSGVLPLDANPQTAPIPAYDFTAQQAREALPMGSKQSRAQISEATRAMAQIASASGVSTEGRISNTQVTDPTTGRALEEPNPVSTPVGPTYRTTSTPAEDPTVYRRRGRGKKVLKDVSHLVSQQMAATVGGGPVTAVGETTRSGEVATVGGIEPTQGRSRGFVPAPVLSNPTDGASAFQPGKKVVSGTAEENKEFSEKLRAQQEHTGSAGGRGFGSIQTTKPAEMPSYSTDIAGNPIPNPPTVGRRGDKRLFVRGRSAGGRVMPKPLQKFFEPVHAPANGAEGPQVTSGSSAKPARRSKKTGQVIEPEVAYNPGRTAYATPFNTYTPTQPSLPGIDTSRKMSEKTVLRKTDKGEGQEVSELTVDDRDFRKEEESKTTSAKTASNMSMTATDANKYSRTYLQDNPNKGPAQPMLDFGAPEREEEDKRRIASAANSGVDITTGKKFKRSGQQWGFLDKRWLGDIGSTNEELADSVAQENRAKGSEYPRAVVPTPSGLPKAPPGPKSKPVDTDGAGPAALRLLGDMGGSRQLMDAVEKQRAKYASE